MYIILASVILGILPETFYLFYIMKRTRNIKSTSFLLFLAMLVPYIILIVSSDNIWLYTATPLTTYAIFKIYDSKTNIVDILFFMVSLIALMIIAVVSFYAVENYWAAYAIDRVLLVVLVMCVKDNLHKWRNIICEVWNRRDDGRIKSLTVRNISVSIVFFLVFLASFVLKITVRG